ncbi:MAG: TonB family protein [Burkholderiaceae bacterium]
MKFIVQNPTLSIAFGVSFAVHGALLAVRFVAPEAFRFQPTDPGLEVILVNAKHDKAPLKAQALAQANLDGGGNAEDGRPKSPLPDLRRIQDGDSIATTRRRIDELEEMQQTMLAQAIKRTSLTAPSTSENETAKTERVREAADKTESTQALARSIAEISKDIEQYAKRPKKTQITPSTREVGYAMYYNALQKKIENLGTLNFPEHQGKKLYGELVVSIPIFHDGSIYEKEGGPRVERSSGNKALDQAALRIVRRSAPFGQFPSNMRTAGKDDVWEVITRFKFTREGGVETKLFGSENS